MTDVEQPSITCPQCGRVSYNPNDIEQRYCGNCHQYHDQMAVRDGINWMDLNEFRDLGYLHEINRQVLHPAGLALAVDMDDEGRVTGFAGVWDYRDDPEGVLFAVGEVEQAKIDRVLDEQKRHYPTRVKLIGGMIQHVDSRFSDEEVSGHDRAD